LAEQRAKEEAERKAAEEKAQLEEEAAARAAAEAAAEPKPAPGLGIDPQVFQSGQPGDVLDGLDLKLPPVQ
jgi:hypothetical protein